MIARGAARRVTAMAAALVCGWLASGCPGNTHDVRPEPPPPATIVSIAPKVVLRGTVVRVEAANFQSDAQHRLRLAGTVSSSSDAAPRTGELTVALATNDAHLEWTVDDAFFDAFGAGSFSGSAVIISRNAWGETVGTAMEVGIALVDQLRPELAAVGEGLVFVNGAVPIEGDGLLQGGAEGTTSAELAGCFLPAGASGSCAADGAPVEATLQVLPDTPTRRDRGAFVFGPQIAGIVPGRFEGTVTLVNEHSGGPVVRGTSHPVSYDLQPPRVTGFGTSTVSLGQFLQIHGDGFVGGAEGSTLIRFQGELDDGGERTQVSFDLVTGMVDGTLATYVLEEQQGIGAVIDLRRQTGVLSGSWTPVTSWRSTEQQGTPAQLALSIGGVKQVVWVRFLDSWIASLRHFGLQAADQLVRARIFEVLRRDYAGLNVEFREAEPDDFALFGRVDIGGSDPNGLGLLGYDNTPGKDVENRRLADRIGGVNALTQEDGYPGYGGVFAESYFGFSEHPPAGMPSSPLHTPLFDQIFDPVRPDTGQEVTSGEVLAAPDPQTISCPGETRLAQVACAIHVLGNLIGHTTSHELGHALGLADPYGSPTSFHNPGDVPNRLMEGGGGRPFAERAELEGQGPAVFCDDEYAYLKTILPHPDPDPVAFRPSCY